MITTDLAILLDIASKHIEETLPKLIAADKAAEDGLLSLEALLRWLAEPRNVIHKLMFTGSRCYGTPHAKSDWDWVIKIGGFKREVELMPMADQTTDSVDKDYKEGGYRGDARLDRAYRFGPINLITVSGGIQWRAWKSGTKLLIEEAPVTRDRAIEVFKTEYQNQIDIHDQEMAMQYA